MSIAGSPFSSVRWESTSPRLYFLSKDIRQIIEQPGQAYLIGSRGTGKTTILQALNWEQRLNNASLQAQIEDPFAKGQLGVYLKLPDHQIDQLDDWLGDDVSTQTYASVVSTYLDLLWVPLLIQALDGLRVRQVLRYSAADERRVVEGVMDELPASYFDGQAKSSREPTLRNLRRALEWMRDLVVSSARRKTDVNDVLDRLSAGGPGTFGRSLAAALVELCPPAASGDHWRVFVCMDEGEGLNDRQQIVLNTMVRHAEAPVAFLVAFVARPHEDTRTINPNLHLQRADRELVLRDEMTTDNRRNDFRDLAEGVATVRVQQRLPDQRVDLERVLGRLDIDSILVDLLRRSDRKGAEELLVAAVELHDGGDGSLPVRAAWLKQRKLDREDGFEGPERRRRSTGRRRSGFMVLLAICSELNLRPRYASADMLLSLSDGCVRDFLWQMDELYSASATNLESFLASTVTVERQHRALLAASKQKADGIEEWLVVAPDSGRRVVEGIALLTTALQRLRAIDSPLDAEPGLFELVGDGAVADQAKEYMRDASEAGYLKLLDDTQPTERVRIHLSLAPNFEASYRGAYRASRLEAEEVAAFADARDDDELRRLASATANRIASQWATRRAGAAPDPELPFEEGDD